MDAVQSSKVVNPIALQVSLHKIINLLLVEPNLSLEDSASGHRSSCWNETGRNPQ